MQIKRLTSVHFQSRLSMPIKTISIGIQACSVSVVQKRHQTWRNLVERSPFFVLPQNADRHPPLVPSLKSLILIAIFLTHIQISRSWALGSGLPVYLFHGLWRGPFDLAISLFSLHQKFTITEQTPSCSLGFWVRKQERNIVLHPWCHSIFFCSIVQWWQKKIVPNAILPN